MTVTATASTYTETATETASTKTLVFTETTTVTAATETDIVTEVATVPVTTTLIEVLPTVVSTSTVHQNAPLKAHNTAEQSFLPSYALADCADWNQYTKVCKCVGVEATTITASAAVETMTVTADDAVTTAVATLSSTQTDIVSVTATESATEIETVPVTDLATATVTMTTSITKSVSATSTPLSVVPLMCKPRGQVFRATVPYPNGIRAMNSANGDTIIGWQYGGADSPWVLDVNGYLELASGTHVAYNAEKDTPNRSNNGESMIVKVKPRAEVDAEHVTRRGTLSWVLGPHLYL